MPIYTKTGDKGTTSLFDGTRVLKNNIRVCPYGMVDELNSVVGIIVAKSQKSRGKIKNYQTHIKNELIQIQNDLLTIGSNLANPNLAQDQNLTVYLKKQITHFEKIIDEMTVQMPALHNFILPGGGEIGAFLHLARTVCRRAEREIVGLAQKEEVNIQILIYINRLSDLFFTMSRFVNWKAKETEIIWRKKI